MYANYASPYQEPRPGADAMQMLDKFDTCFVSTNRLKFTQFLVDFSVQSQSTEVKPIQRAQKTFHSCWSPFTVLNQT